MPRPLPNKPRSYHLPGGRSIRPDAKRKAIFFAQSLCKIFHFLQEVSQILHGTNIWLTHERPITPSHGNNATRPDGCGFWGICRRPFGFVSRW
jgi:hypothetical protein